MYEKLFLVVFVFVMYSFSVAWASEPIKITLSDHMHAVNFDGKWTNSTEWKRSSHNKIVDNDSDHIIHLRTAHHCGTS